MRLANAIMIAAVVPLQPVSFPDEAAGWRAVEPPAAYDESSIFQYIDGHGEVYLAYGMRRCLARRYAGPAGEPDILADVFEMASPADAFGVFSHSRDGEAVSLGQDASLAFNTLLFWRGRHFVSVYAERDGARAKEAILALGRELDRAIGESGERPPLVGRLPRNGLEERSIVWLRHPRILDAHARLGPGNPLAVGENAPAAMARYVRGADQADLVVVAYPDRSAAEAATAAFAARLLSGDRGPAKREDGWYASAPLPGGGAARGFVLRASSRQMAASVIAALSEGATP